MTRIRTAKETLALKVRIAIFQIILCAIVIAICMVVS